MPPGKLASQAVHAARLSLLKYLGLNPHRRDEFVGANSSGSVCVLSARSLAQLERAHAQATAAGLPTALFVDSGHVLLPHFDGGHVPTALAIGPAAKDEMRHITKKFPCA